MDKIKIANGVFWIRIPEEEHYILCGCPADVIKHLMIKGLIAPTTVNGVACETGPNVILLADTSIQNGQFSNMAEFPVLQMLYRQGMLLPGHPNNTGKKPIIIGIASQIASQSEYISRGNYGLLSAEEIREAGVPEDMAEIYYRIKLRFAFNKIKTAEELIDFRVIESSPITLPGGVSISRKSLNIYEFAYRNERETVDLNLAQGELYDSPVTLNINPIDREYFSIIHIGEGDGWDVYRPCMCSLIIFQGKIYLIDTGPNILNSLAALGISVNEIAGIFHTHAHDDHFAGLTSLIRSDHRISYYATPLVRSSVAKKLAALMSIREKRFHNSFLIHDLVFNQWTNIDGLEVMPVFSPHPVETNVMFFRTFWQGGYQTYAHLADIPSLHVLNKMLPEEDRENPAAKMIYDEFMRHVFEPVDLKKIDSGGGLIHGEAKDFINDKSQKILLSHRARSLTDAEREIGSNAGFGQTDVLIKSNRDYGMQAAFLYLSEFFVGASPADLNMLLNSPVVSYNIGAIIIEKDSVNRHILLILGGLVEYMDSEKGIHNKLSAGSFLGELSAVEEEPSRWTYHAVSYVRTLQIPIEVYQHLVINNPHLKDIKRVYAIMGFLQETFLFGEMISTIVQYKIAREVSAVFVKEGQNLIVDETPQIILIRKGKAELLGDGRHMENMEAGNFTGEESMILGSGYIFQAVAREDCEVLLIPGKALQEIPIVDWKIRESLEKRLVELGTLLEH